MGDYDRDEYNRNNPDRWDREVRPQQDDPFTRRVDNSVANVSDASAARIADEARRASGG